MTKIAFGDRVLFLSADPQAIERQLRGERLALSEAGPLRDNVSTDEITPATAATIWDERLGRYPYLGLECQGQRPIRIDAVKNGGFSVTVAGKRYGKGSSREHSPRSERLSGIRLVIAESFERIYRQNADNIGLFTSTDFGLIERIQHGEAIDLEELLAGRDPQAADVLRAGGLLRFGRERMSQLRRAHVPAQARPLTLVEKIIQRHAMTNGAVHFDPTPGTPAVLRPDWRFIIEYYTPMIAYVLGQECGSAVPLAHPDSILLFEDHTSYVERSPAHLRAGMVPLVNQVIHEHRRFAVQHGLRTHGRLAEGLGSEGISHPLVAERYALPGQIVVGTDSHTTHSGAVGCLAFGVGSTEMANSLLADMVRVAVPATLRIDLAGSLQPGVTAKDVVLHLLALPSIRAGAGVGKVFEFTGTAVAGMSLDERATLTNMTAELGGLTGIVAPDAETVRFLADRRGVEFGIEDWMRSDPGATYAETIEVDCPALVPMVARPGDPGLGTRIEDIEQRPKIDFAYGGSCTGGKRGDFDDYHAVFSWAARRGLKVAPNVKLYLQFGTVDVRSYCERMGYLPAFEQVGAEILQPSCGACVNHGPGASSEAGQVTVSAINRNFPGRSGPGQVWLASPPTVAASAIAGEIVSFSELKARWTIA